MPSLTNERSMHAQRKVAEGISDNIRTDSASTPESAARNTFHVMRSPRRRQCSDAGPFRRDIAGEVPIASTLARAGQMAALIERSPEPSPLVSREANRQRSGTGAPGRLPPLATPSSDAVPPEPVLLPLPTGGPRPPGFYTPRCRRCSRKVPSGCECPAHRTGTP